MNRTFIVVVFIFINSFVDAQPDAKKIIREVNGVFERVQDYTADVKIKTDIAFVNILPVNAKVFFKQPDKFHMQSKGIAILPRQGVGNMLAGLRDTLAYTAFYLMDDNLSGVKVSVINILPVSDTSEIIVGKFWIDTQRKLVMRSQITGKTNGTVDAVYQYGLHAAFALPDKIVFTIDTKKFKVPKAIAADINNYEKENAGKENKKGMITLLFTNYAINKGVDNSVFKSGKRD